MELYIVIFSFLSFTESILKVQSQIIGVAWEYGAGSSSRSSSDYGRSFQDPGGKCRPNPCGVNTECQVDGRGNAICECLTGFIPSPNPIDGCCLPKDYPQSPLIMQNRLGGGHYQRQSKNPCEPSPCGPGTICKVNHQGNPICRCQPGRIPNPDTITGCKAECSNDYECRMGMVCRNHKCTKKPNPCHPNPCGYGAECTKNAKGNAICKCKSGLIPKPDTITGCGPECTKDAECRRGNICKSNRCVVKPNPCVPSPCGPGAICKVNRQGNAICRCRDGLIPKPDTITGCGPECTLDSDCRYGFICQSNKCVEKSDPCNPSPCGSGTTCKTNSQGNAICRCKPGLIPKPDTITGCGPECTSDYDCHNEKICKNQKCVEKPDPCVPTPCGPGASCMLDKNGNAICRCLPGLIPKPDTISGCAPECVKDSDCNHGDICQNQKCIQKPDPCIPSPCGPGTTCTVNHNGNPICRCHSGLVPKPDTITGCGPECTSDSDCNHGYICQSQKCIEKPDPCDPSPCGPGAHCMINSNGNAICRCEAGLVPKPDTITGCGPECTLDSDCQYEYICQNQKCIEKPDPCVPSPCGSNTECTLSPNGNAICKCLSGFIPKPDTITGCGRECVQDAECTQGFICQEYKCIERPDPCDPTPCGPNTICKVNHQGNPVCTCEPGFAPQSNTIEGCTKLEPRTPPPDPCYPSPCGSNTHCAVNQNGHAVCRCNEGFIPMRDSIVGCVEKPDPCHPNPCGTNAICNQRDNSYTCKCPAGHFGNAHKFCRQGDCQRDDECSVIQACFNYKCIDPCSKSCGTNAKCEVQSHRAVCSCPEGHSGDPLASCEKSVVIGGRYSSTQGRTVPQNQIIIGQQYSQGAEQNGIIRGRTGSNVSGRRVVIGGKYEPQIQSQEVKRSPIIGARSSSSPCGQSSFGCANNGLSGRTAFSSARRPLVVIGASGKRRKKRRANRNKRFITVLDLYPY